MIVSSDILGITNFTNGTKTSVNSSQGYLKLNLSTIGGVRRYNDSYATTLYTTDAYNYSNVGYYAAGGYLFSGDLMTSSVGNITYRFTSSTAFANATALFYEGVQHLKEKYKK